MLSSLLSLPGCCVNHYYRVPVRLDPNATQDVRAPEGDFANKPSGGAFKTPFRNLDPPPRGHFGLPCQ
jgi:hypothetical protein